MINKYIKLFASCKLVRGFKQSTVCDLERGGIYIVPNDLCEIIDDAKKYCIRDLENIYDIDVIREYFNFLTENEFAFFTAEPDNFPEIGLEYTTPTVIHNSVVEISTFTADVIENIIHGLINLRCRFIELRIFDDIEELFFRKLLDNFKESPLQGIHIYGNYSESSKLIFSDLLNSYPEISIVVLFKNDYKDADSDNQRILVGKGSLDSRNCGCINVANFIANIPTFNLSSNYNSCLFQKVSIDKYGNIKNCPSMSRSYGNIRDTKLIDVVNNPEYQKVWHIKKDEITKCKDCEFRHVCTDCRAYLDNPEDQYSAPLKCGYNPYTCEWEEWSTNPLKHKAIEFYGMQDLVKRP